jgi:hypothetical protein
VGSLKNVIDELAKLRFLVFFILLWGASMLLYAICNLGSYGFGVQDFYDVVWIIANLLELVSGIFLLLFGLQLLSRSFLTALKIEKTLVYFLLFWAGQFFFWGLYDLLYYEGIVCILAALVYLIAGVMLALFAFKSLTEKETPPSIPPPPPQ